MRMKWQRSQSETLQLLPRPRLLSQDRPHRLPVSTIATLRAIPQSVRLPTPATARLLQWRIVLPPPYRLFNDQRAVSQETMAHPLQRRGRHTHNLASTLVLSQHNRAAMVKPAPSRSISNTTAVNPGPLNLRPTTAATVRITGKAPPKQHAPVTRAASNNCSSSSRAHRTRQRIQTTRVLQGRHHRVLTSVLHPLPCSHCIPAPHSKPNNKGLLTRTLARNHKPHSMVSKTCRGERRRTSLRSHRPLSTVCHVHKYLLSPGERVALLNLRNSNSNSNHSRKQLRSSPVKG